MLADKKPKDIGDMEKTERDRSGCRSIGFCFNANRGFAGIIKK